MSAGSGIKAHWGFSDYTLEGDAAHTLAVNTGNGNLVVTATDKAFPARIPAVLMRTYNSVNSSVSGMLGKGWMFSFEEKVEKSGADYLYTDTTGAEYKWLWNVSTFTYDRPTGVFSDLTVVSSEVIITMPNGFKRVFDEMGGYLKRYEDTNGNILTFVRNGSNQVVSIDSESGLSTAVLVTFDYDVNGLCERFGQDPTTGPAWILDYDDVNGLLTSITDPADQVWTYGYTSDVMDKIMDPRYVSGVVNAEISYTSAKVTSITDYDENDIGFDYSGYETTVNDRRGEDTVMTHDDDGTLALIEIELPLPYVFPRVVPYTISFVWTSLTLTQVTDAEGRETDYTYDSNGNVTDITKKDDDDQGQTTDLTYDTNNTLLTVTTPEGNETVFTYDNARNLETIQLPVEVAAQSDIKQNFYYDESGNGDLYAVKDQVGQAQLFTYDATYGVVISSSLVNAAAGESVEQTTTYEYEPEACQWVTKVVNPSGITQEFSHDDLGRVTQISTDPDGLDLKTTYTYDTCGNVTNVRPPKGNAPETPVDDYDVDYTYDKLNNLATTLLPETSTGVTYEYGYDANENLTSYKQHLVALTSFETTYTYDEINRLDKTTLPTVSGASGPSEYEIEYDAVGNVTKTIDALDIETDYTYNYLNQVLTEAGPIDDLKFGYTYDTDGRLTEIIGQPGDLPSPYQERKYVYTYNANGWLTSLKDPTYDETDGNKTNYSYYANGQLETVQLPNQAKKDEVFNRTYVYETTGLVSSVADPGGFALSYTYRQDGRVATQTDSESNITAYTYDGVGRTTRVSYATQVQWAQSANQAPHAAFVFDENGNISKLTGPDGFRTEYTYDYRDRLTKMTRFDDEVPQTPPSFEISYTYDQLDRNTSTTSQRGSINDYTYDAHSRLTKLIVDTDQGPYTGFNYTTDYEYDLNGRVTKITNPDSGEVEYEYDALGRVTKRIDEIDGEVTKTYDLWGNLTQQVWQDGTSDTYEYDELQRLTTQTNALGEAYEYGYDFNGNNTTLSAPWGAFTTFGYNDRDELVTVRTTDPTADDTRTQIENFKYTNNGRLASYTGVNQESWTFQYDAMGRWTSAMIGEAVQATRAYNSSNTLARSQGLDGGLFLMEYNGYRLRTKTTASDAATPNATDYTWTDLDLSKVEEPGSINRPTTTFTRDKLGRISSVSRTDDGGLTTENTAYTYNWRNQITQRVLPNSLGQEDYSYDLRGLLEQVDYTNPTAVINLDYDARGRQVMATFPNGVTRFFNYNQAGRMVVDILQDANSWVFMTYYSYDQHGRRVVNVLDRKFISGSTAPPIFTPQNDDGNPVIPTGSAQTGGFVPNYTETYYDAETWINSAKDSSYTIYHLERTSGTGPNEKVYAENGSAAKVGIEGQVTYSQPPGTYVLIDLLPDPWDIPQSTLQIPGQWTATPTAYAATNLLKDTTPTYDYANEVVQEVVAEDELTSTTDDYDRGKECCGKFGMSSAGAAVASEKSGRSMIKQQMSFDKTLKTSGKGNMNVIPMPWYPLVEDAAPLPAPLESTLSVGRIETGQEEIRNTIKESFGHIELNYDPTSGRMDKITKFDDSDQPVGLTEVELYYDNYGRLLRVDDNTQVPAVTKNYHNDWHTGNMDVESDGTTTQTCNHGPGCSRYNGSIPPWESQWDINGPDGSPKWTLRNDGKMTHYHGYSTLGNNIQEEQYNGASAQPPRSMGGDQRPVESYAQMTVGNSESRDHTPMIGALDSPLASGAKAGGNCGNPDCTEHNHNGWSVVGPGGESTGPAYPPGDPLPGTGTTDEKKAAQYNTQADRRLRAMWLEREYFGAKPGEQVGAILVDDGRDIRKPLASAPCPGGNGGPHKFGSGGQEKPPNGWSVGGNGLWTGPAVRPDGPRFLPAGPWPMQPNDWAMTQDGRSVWCGEGDPPTDGHTQDSGTTEEAENAWDKVKGFVEDAWNSPLGAVAAVAAIAGAVVIGALAAPAAITLAGVAALMGTALLAGAAANLIFGGVDVAMGGMAGNAIDNIGGGAVTNVARGIRDAFNTATIIVETLALGLGIAGAGAALGAGGFIRLGSQKIDDFGRAIFRSATQEADTYVYLGMRNGKDVYVGITINLPQRLRGHGSRFEYLEKISEALPKDKARAIEQAIINRNRKQALKNPDLLYENIKNSIDPKHDWSADAVKWGEEWLRRNGY